MFEETATLFFLGFEQHLMMVCFNVFLLQNSCSVLILKSQMCWSLAWGSPTLALKGQFTDYADGGVGEVFEVYWISVAAKSNTVEENGDRFFKYKKNTENNPMKCLHAAPVVSSKPQHSYWTLNEYIYTMF